MRKTFAKKFERIKFQSQCGWKNGIVTLLLLSAGLKHFPLNICSIKKNVAGLRIPSCVFFYVRV